MLLDFSRLLHLLTTLQKHWLTWCSCFLFRESPYADHSGWPTDRFAEAANKGQRGSRTVDRLL